MSMTSNELIAVDTKISSSGSSVNEIFEKVTELDRNLKMALEAAHHAAEIILTVTDFREVLHTRAADRDTQYKISMGREHQHLSVDLTGKTPKLKVKNGSGPMILKFKIMDGEANKIYYPLAVSFKRHSSVHGAGQFESDHHGHQNVPFSSMHVYNSHVYLVGFSMPKEEGMEYKFSAIFQAEDAKIAIIDPVIENDDLN